MAKVTIKRHSCDDGYLYTRAWFICPGCKGAHGVTIERGPASHPDIPVWGFNGSVDNPTFTPSLLVWHDEVKDDDGNPTPGTAFRCHSYITNGQIQLLDDCTHENKNITMDLPELDPDHWLSKPD